MREYLSSRTHLRTLLLLMGDGVLIGTCFFFALGLRNFLFTGEPIPARLDRFTFSFVVMLLFQVLFHYIFGLYDAPMTKRKARCTVLAFASVLASLMAMVILGYFFDLTVLGRVAFFSYLLACSGLAVCWRLLLNRLHNGQKGRVIVVGNGDVRESIRSDYLDKLSNDFAHIEYFSFNGDSRWNREVWERIAEQVNGNGRVSILFPGYDSLPSSLASNVLNLQIKGVEVNSLTQYFIKNQGCVPVYNTDLSTLMNLSRTISRTTHALKRIHDILFSALVLLLFSPVLLLIAILIRLDSKGPVFFVQKRMGKHGEEYPCIKFRTMVNNAEERTGPTWTRKGDPRVTRVGKILRSTRMDELPQFFNVLRGEMSVVGPRPIRQFFEAQYQEKVPYYRLRHLVKPGITGWAQVHQKDPRTDVGVRERLEHDLFYIMKMSIFLDFLIQLRTINTLIHKVGKESAI